ncbi:MAG TPA: creatininase family protein, partial [Bacteroidia bacterium]|nr:creatininase family protein [Bacteroidia bacterium]
TWKKVMEYDPVASHASWMENFPWTRISDVEQPGTPKKMIDTAHLRSLSPAQIRDYLGDGNFGGAYFKPDEIMEDIWRTAVSELRTLIGKM